jgi:hypothetical protein
MRYHWGLAVGHIYTHGQTASKMTNADKSISTAHSVDLDPDADSDVMLNASGSAATPDSGAFQDDGSDVEQVDSDDLESVDLGDDPEGEGPEDSSDDDMVLAMEDMYGAGSS